MTNNIAFYAYACVTILLALFLIGCIPPLDQVVSSAADSEGVSRGGGATLILEEIQSSDSRLTERFSPESQDLTDYTDALDMRIGALYQPYTRTEPINRFQSCVEQYRRYLLRVDSLESRPVPKDAHPSLKDQIKDIQTLAIAPLSTRIGNADINNNNNVALLPILVVTERGYTVGELECRKNIDRWYMYDVILDVESIENDTTEAIIQFNPLLF